MKFRTVVGVAACAGLLTIPAVASAHTAVVRCGDRSGVVEVASTNGYVVASWVVNADGVVVSWADGYADPKNPYPLPTGCVYPTEPPVPPVPEQVPPEVSVPPVSMGGPTCADLKRLGAGRKWYVKLGCPLPPKPPAPRVITCSFVRAHYSPKLAEAYLIRHNISTGCLRPFNPPVAG